MVLPTTEQQQAYARDGFVVVTDWLGEREIDALLAVRAALRPPLGDRSRTGRGELHAGSHAAGSDPAALQRVAVRSVVARTVLAERNARFAAALEGAGGMVLIQDNMLWKPPGGRALLAHQDNAYNSWLDPVNMTTCWMALDDTAADTGTIYYVRGSHRWPPGPLGGSFHAPEDWLAHVRTVIPADAKADLDRDLVPIEVPAGGAAFHHGWTFHGSPPNRRVDAQRRSVVSHLARIGTGHHPTNRHPIYSRYLRPGSLALDEAHFPVVWSADGYRTPWLDA